VNDKHGFKEVIFGLVLVLLRVIRGIVGVVAGFQVFGIFPAFSWIGSAGEITPEMWGILLAKLVALIVFVGLFIGLRVLINYIGGKYLSKPSPILKTEWQL